MASSSSSSSSFFLLATIISCTIFLVHGFDADLKHFLSLTPSDCEKGPHRLYEACIKITNKDYTGAASSLLLVGAEAAVTVAEDIQGLENEETSEPPLKKALAECQKIYVAAANSGLKIAKDLHDKKPLAQAQPSLASFFSAGITCEKEFIKANLKSPMTAVNEEYAKFGRKTEFILALTPEAKQSFA